MSQKLTRGMVVRAGAIELQGVVLSIPRNGGELSECGSARADPHALETDLYQLKRFITRKIICSLSRAEPPTLLPPDMFIVETIT